MFEFFDSVANIFSSIVDFVVMVIKGIIDIVTLIGKGAVAVFLVIQQLPTIVTAFAIAFVSFCIIINITKGGG